MTYVATAMATVVAATAAAVEGLILLPYNIATNQGLTTCPRPPFPQ